MIWDRTIRECVVVVDANPHDYHNLADLISRADVEIRFVSSGNEALAACLTHMPALWIVNLDLPDMSGIDLRTMLRRRGIRAPVALVGDRYSVADEIRARTAGAEIYLAKPVHHEVVEAAV